jgi:hypothetical protein
MAKLFPNYSHNAKSSKGSGKQISDGYSIRRKEEENKYRVQSQKEKDEKRDKKSALETKISRKRKSHK